MASRHPGVKVVVDHFGMIDLQAADSEQVMEQLLALALLPNVYMRTTLTNPSKERLPFRDMWPYLQRIYEAFGARRMIFADFHELLVMSDLIPFFTEEDKEWILGRTALGVYRWAA